MRLTISESSPLADIKALLDTYGVELTLSGRVILRAPLYLLSGWGVNPVEPRTPQQFVWPRIKKGLHLTMIRSGPPHRDEDSQEPSAERWPFYVGQKMEVHFTLPAAPPESDQWWSFIFSPGRSYEERHSPEEA